MTATCATRKNRRNRHSSLVKSILFSVVVLQVTWIGHPPIASAFSRKLSGSPKKYRKSVFPLLRCDTNPTKKNDDGGSSSTSCLVVVDFENVRGKSAFTLTHEQLLERSLEWYNHKNNQNQQQQYENKNLHHHTQTTSLALVIDHGAVQCTLVGGALDEDNAYNKNDNTVDCEGNNDVDNADDVKSNTHQQNQNLTHHKVGVVFSGPGSYKADDAIVTIVGERCSGDGYALDRSATRGRTTGNSMNRTVVVTADSELITRCQRARHVSAMHSDVVYVDPITFLHELEAHATVANVDLSQGLFGVNYEAVDNNGSTANGTSNTQVATSSSEFTAKAIRKEMQARQELLAIEKKLGGKRGKQKQRGGVSRKKRTKLQAQRLKARERLEAAILASTSTGSPTLYSLIDDDDHKEKDADDDEHPPSEQSSLFDLEDMIGILKEAKKGMPTKRRNAESTYDRKILSERLRRRLQALSGVKAYDKIHPMKWLHHHHDPKRKQQVDPNNNQVFQSIDTSLRFDSSEETGSTAPSAATSDVECNRDELRDDIVIDMPPFPTSAENQKGAPNDTVASTMTIDASTTNLTQRSNTKTKRSKRGVDGTSTFVVPIRQTDRTIQDDVGEGGNSGNGNGDAVIESLRIVAISDTHGFESELSKLPYPHGLEAFADDEDENHSDYLLPSADVLIHCGDFSNHKGNKAAKRLDKFLAAQTHIPTKIVVKGNHDTGAPAKVVFPRSKALYATQNRMSVVTIKGVQFCLMPFSFKGAPSQIPECDVLVTHEPPFGVQDRTYQMAHAGSSSLRRAVENSPTKPRLWLCGHIHEGRGASIEQFFPSSGTKGKEDSSSSSSATTVSSTLVLNVANANPGRAKKLVAGSTLVDVEYYNDNAESSDDNAGVPGEETQVKDIKELLRQDSLEALAIRELNAKEHVDNTSCRKLLAVDLGLRSAAALFDENGKFLRVNDWNFKDADDLEAALPDLLANSGATHVVVEGINADLYKLWSCAVSTKQKLARVSAEDWRKTLLLPREHRNAQQSKAAARLIARQIVARDGLEEKGARSTDAAEAIMVGYHAVRTLGWRDSSGPAVQRYSNGNVVR